MNRTGFADGTLSPIIYYEAPNGWVELAPKEKGDDDYFARMAYARKYEPKGWMWREARSLPEWSALEKRLVEQERQKAEHESAVRQWDAERTRKETHEKMYARMITSQTSQFEKDFIRAWIQLRDDKRAQYENRLTEHNWHLRALNYDSTTKPEDQIPGLV